MLLDASCPAASSAGYRVLSEKLKQKCRVCPTPTAYVDSQVMLEPCYAPLCVCACVSLLPSLGKFYYTISSCEDIYLSDQVLRLKLGFV